MDALAFLLESNSMCTGFTVLNNKLIIAANEIYKNSNKLKNKKINLINTVFDYLLKIINSKNDY